ncbi:hypothetical protein [Methanolobus bombayensis]|uniref:hypothetical protein n=1 Tax=Methanolobus bombayensis TaxID=38023 RepID=UPI001AE7A8B7|nr:hypothetical protein [Methanolobus bombayensis]MBP1910377.1 hypothetical protein [Methanolobus bombayensis]
MNTRKLSLIAAALVLFSLFAVSAMAADQQRDRDQDCTNAPELAPMWKHGQTTDGVTVNGDGICDNFVDEDGDGVCDNCQNDGVCDGTGPHGAGNGQGAGNGLRDGSCIEE